MKDNMKIIKGNIIFTETSKEFKVIENGYIILKNGIIENIVDKLGEEYKNLEIIDYGNKLIIPGFIDMHLHAPQFANRGLGLDKELLPWLETYTFPEESKFSDDEYARKIYSRFVHELWKNGTTSSIIFATIHKDSTNILMNLLNDAGLAAYVGKVNMDRNSPDYLIEKTEDSLVDTEEWICEHTNVDSIVKPIITPRFVPSCSSELMRGLGELAEKYNLPVQSHLSENRGEIEWVKELHPNSKNYADVYNEYKLFGQTPTVMAHCVFNDEDEITLMAENKIFVAHSPISNFNLSSGIAPVRKYLNADVNVGFATDVSGGHSLSMKDVIVSAIQSSKMRWVYLDDSEDSISLPEAFYLSTKSSGAFFGKVGSFENGYDFDALIIDDENISSIDANTVVERLEKFIYIGDDRNIFERYVKGNKLIEPKIY